MEMVAICRYPVHSAETHIHLCLFQKAHLLLQLVRMPSVVTVLKCDQFTIRAFRAIISRITRAMILVISQILHSRIADLTE